jgi:4,5-DOPA dioxygenase extradiol
MLMGWHSVGTFIPSFFGKNTTLFIARCTSCKYMDEESPVKAGSGNVSSSLPGQRMPVIFIGHGSPENALGTNEFNTNWKRLGSSIPRPRLILCISAHWVIQEGTAVTAMKRPKTIHDFYGFPPELYALHYDAPGSAEGAELIRKIVKSIPVNPDYEWGLDHGTWSVLLHMYPEADIPVIQLSLNYNHPLPLHFRIGEELSSLREEGVLIIGSGNLVHNLMMLQRNGEPYPWALDFDRTVKDRILKRDYGSLVSLSALGDVDLAHPSTEHYLPLLYVLGAAGTDTPHFFNETFFGRSVSMRSIVFNREPMGE